jgi:mono/diheme cytochrome c family protein
MKRLHIHLLCVMLAAAAASAEWAEADDSSFTSTAGLASNSGAEIYSHICQGCHMPQGQGAVGAGHYPALANNRNLAAWQYVGIIVLGGRDGMPPFGLPVDQVLETRTVHLSDAQVADVVNYVRSHFGNRYDDAVSAADIGAARDRSKPAP